MTVQHVGVSPDLTYEEAQIFLKLAASENPPKVCSGSLCIYWNKQEKRFFCYRGALVRFTVKSGSEKEAVAFLEEYATRFLADLSDLHQKIASVEADAKKFLEDATS